MPHVSKSQLNELMECPKLYWYHRFQGVQGLDSLGLIVGTAYHYVWQEFFRHKQETSRSRTLEWCLDVAVDKFRVGVLEAERPEWNPPEDDEALDDLVRVVQAYWPYAEVLEPLLVEQHYSLSIPGTEWTLDGYIDLAYKSYLYQGEEPVLDEVGEHRWVPVVVDHKTTGSTPYATDERQETWLALNSWNHEAIVYALAFRVLTGLVEDRFEYHYAVKTKQAKIQIAPVRIGEAQVRWLLDLAVEQIEKIKRGFFERNTTSLAHNPKYCPAWNLCHGIVDQGPAQIKVV